MKKKLLFLFSLFLVFFFSRRNIDNKEESKTEIIVKTPDSIFVPKFAVLKPDYEINKFSFLTNEETALHKGITLKLENFLYDNEEVDISPDYDYQNLYAYSSSEKPRNEIYFNAKKIKKEYSFYYEKDKLICVLEGIYDDDAIFKGDSLFFYDDKIFLWKNTSNKFVNDSIFLDGKSKYIMRLDKEIKEIKDLGFTQYIDRYEYENDSLSNFVIGNLK